MPPVRDVLAIPLPGQVLKLATYRDLQKPTGALGAIELPAFQQLGKSRHGILRRTYGRCSRANDVTYPITIQSMIRLRHKLMIQALRIADQLMLMVAGVGVIYLRPELASPGRGSIVDIEFTLLDGEKMLLLLIGWLGVFEYFIEYKVDRLVDINTQFKSLLKASCAGSLLLTGCGLVSGTNLNLLNVFQFFWIVTCGGICSRLLLWFTLLGARRSRYNYRFLLFVGTNDRAREVARRIESKKELGYRIVGFVAESAADEEDWRERSDMKWRILGVLEDFRSILSHERVDEVIVCLPADSRPGDISMIVLHARDLGIVVRLTPNYTDGMPLKNMLLEKIEDEYVVTLFREDMLMQLLVKRMTDALASFVLLAMLLPLMAAVAILIKLTSPGPVLFTQRRVGMNQRQFMLYKFRSMVADAEERKPAIKHLNERDGPAFKMENDPRTTWLGRLMRKTSIDELPQLINVLKGEMSLVGPRPPLPEEVKCYEWLYRKRLSVKPGVTCIWQISGRNNVSFDRWMAMDHEYIENWSLWLDLKILAITIPAVLFRRGAS